MFYAYTTGSGEPVLLLHGFTGTGDSWRQVAERLPFHCIMPDLAGHGKTMRLAASIEEEAARLHQWMTEAGHDSFHVIGYSMGGRLALALAIRFPDSVRSLILESASPGLETESERTARRQSDEQLAGFIEENGVPAFVERWEQVPLFHTQRALSERVRERIRTERLSHTRAGLASSLRNMGTGRQPSYWEQLSSLHVPVLLLTGTEDQKFEHIAQNMVQQLPNAVWQSFSGVGHAIHVEQPEKFGTIIKTFLFNHQRRNKDGS